MPSLLCLGVLHLISDSEAEHKSFVALRKHTYLMITYNVKLWHLTGFFLSCRAV